MPLKCCYYLQPVLIVGGRGHLDVQSSWVTALAFPQNKGLMDGCMGLSTDSLLIGRIDGSLGLVEIIDSSTYHRKELEHCYRKDGEINNY